MWALVLAVAKLTIQGVACICEKDKLCQLIQLNCFSLVGGHIILLARLTLKAPMCNFLEDLWREMQYIIHYNVFTLKYSCTLGIHNVVSKVALKGQTALQSTYPKYVIYFGEEAKFYNMLMMCHPL